MNTVILLGVICFTICCIIWMLPKLIGYILIKKFKLNIKIGRFSLPCLSLRAVKIIKNGFSIQIDEINIRSSFFSSDVNKFLAITIRDIRVNKDINDSNASNEDNGDSGNDEPPTDANFCIFDFRNKHVSPRIIKFVQFMSINIQNISVVMMNNTHNPSWFLHATAGDLHVDGSTMHNVNTLVVTAALNDARLKFFRHHLPTNSNETAKVKPCLAELSFCIALESVLPATGPLCVEKLQVLIDQTKTSIHDGLYDFIRDTNRLKLMKESKRTKSSPSPDIEEICHRISPIIPKNIILKVDNAAFAAVRDDSPEDFSAKLQSFTFNGKFSNDAPKEQSFCMPSMYAAVQLELFEIDTPQEKLLFVELFTIDTQFENKVLNTFVNVKSFKFVYNHDEIYNWLNNNILASAHSAQSKPLSLILPSHQSLEKRRFSFGRTGDRDFEWLMKQIVVKGRTEIIGLTVLTKLNHRTSLLSIDRTKILLDQFNAKHDETYENHFLNMLLGNRHWSTELMIESLQWSLDNVPARDLAAQTHVRGSPIYIGVSLVKLGKASGATELDVKMHTLRLEYSNYLTNLLLQFKECIQKYRMQAVKRRPIEVAAIDEQCRRSNSSDASPIKLAISAKVTDVTTFLFTNHEACILFSLAGVTLTRTQQKSVLNMDELHLAVKNGIAQQINQPMNLSEFTDIFIKIKLLRIEYTAKQRTAAQQLIVHVLNDVLLMWNSNLHMQCLSLYKDIKQFAELMVSKRSAPVAPPQRQTSTNSCDDEKSTIEHSTKTVFEIYAERNIEVGIKLSERHSMQLFFENLLFSRKEQTLISVEKTFINIDDVHIITFTEAAIHSAPSLEYLRVERSNYEHFVCPVNRALVITIGSLKIIFPYDHDFADAMQNEFNSLVKWLKVLHGIQGKPFSTDSPLPTDMVVQIKEFLLEMSDDPFEVKLRDNYVLLVDEYHESIKRDQLFEQKIQQIKASRLLLPTEALAELRANLVKKNSEIYIQRSKKIREAGPTRTRLFAWTLSDLEIMIMADPSLHGPENVVQMMRDIDSDSPWPEDGLDFVTLWCRAVNFSCSEWKFLLRDFPQPMFYVKKMHLFGHLCGAEQAAPPRAKCDVDIVIGAPFETHTIQRSLLPLKFYHDFDCDWDLCSYAFGPCWEPVMAQCNLSFEKIIAPSRDPSPTLPFWDKMRLLYHGRLTIIAKQFTTLLHASLDPYNTTEEMELSWNNCGIIWTNSKVIFKGELNVCVRTASRYDDCRLLHFPNLKATFKLHWVCLANPNDHHVVIPCAPDKLPEYSSNQEHDSYRAFRSQNLNIWVSFETRPLSNGQQNEIDVPKLVLYGSTLRWFESLKLILSGVTRPTRRGNVFNNVRPRKKQLSRHYRKVHLQMSLHKFQVIYWMSHALQRGFELNGGRVTFSSEHTLGMSEIDDGLKHRKQADWATMYMNCELNDTEIWLKSILNDKVDASTGNLDSLKIVKFYFLSLAKVSYGREALIQSANTEPKQKDTPIHKLVVYDLKGAWTKNNRDVAFALFDSFMKSQKLKYNLSMEALQGFRKDNTNTPLKSRTSQMAAPPATQPTASSSTSQQILNATASNTSAINQKPQSSHASTMLQQLIAEADHKFNVYSDDLSTQTREQQLEGLQACQDEDVTQYNWFISLVNSQVLLKGCETSGYVIMSAAKAEILQRVHRPVWRDGTLVSKTTWVGFLECMQYYATVSPGENDSLLDENIMWLTLDNIQEKDKDATVINELPDIPHLVGSGQSVGGVVSETVGAPGNTEYGEAHPIQLQRIVSRCKCEFFYVSYGDTIDPSSLVEVPQPPVEEALSPWERQDDPVDAFTLMHHDLNVCTNSLQYAMILDIVNNLMLYQEPQRKQALEKLVRKRFQLQLNSSEDQKRPIQHMQTQIRNLMSRMRLLEKDIHLISRARAEEGDSDELKHEYEEVQKQIQECKDQLTGLSEELDVMFSCYKETQLSAMNKLATVRKNKPITIVRTNEICFKHAEWRLTEADGQIGIADLILSNFLYTKKSKSDDSVEHLLELGYIRMKNLIPRETYTEVLRPTETQKDMPVDHQKVLRIFCREKQPVGGISVKEHFEINVVPITLAITRKFYSRMLKFCFPDRDTSDAEALDEMDDGTSSISGSTTSIRSVSSAKKSMRSKKSNKDSAFYVKIEKDDVEKMKERAEKNKLFVFIKIPEVPVRVSYKGNKQKNFKDITDFSLVIPTLEYHNVTWTWLDLLLAMKTDSRRVILSQAIKQKLQINRNRSVATDGERPSPQEEDKAKMLFGNRHAPENKSTRKGVFKFPTKQ